MRSVQLKVADFDRSVAFYERLIGIRLVGRFQHGENWEAVFTPSGKLTHDASMLVLGHDADRKTPIDPESIGWIAIHVPDVDAALARVRAAGYPVVSEPEVGHEGRTRIAIVKDPDGFKVEILGFTRAQP